MLDVVRLLARKVQGDLFFKLLCQKDASPFISILPTNSHYFFNTSTPLTIYNETFDDLVIECKTKSKILLNKDAVLPSPWSRSRLVKTLSHIGEGRQHGSWKQDKQNHYVQLWLPMRLAWVKSGNHSITSGIIQSTGHIETHNVLDISKIYDHVTCDGINYIRKHDNKVIAPVYSVEIAAIFEIGRMIKDELNSSTEHEIPNS
ncbi:DUF6710 family protein [Paenisporosarcina sp. TG20]|uniref:DUF6710 family protein n=1 Tax=Paenisporosarcina sp. TG20 TaxID=1211706 RepID=UPI000306FB02|nr:DUF6710 family protein [Paenisporosarcina sp. TG20]